MGFVPLVTLDTTYMCVVYFTFRYMYFSYLDQVVMQNVINFLRNISSGAALFQHFFLELSESVKDLDTRHIAMFHRSTADLSKAHVLTEFPQPECNLL